MDLRYAALIFEGYVITKVDDRTDYGEPRFVSLGLVKGEAFVVVHTKRGSTNRIITAWKGGERERRRYQASIAG